MKHIIMILLAAGFWAGLAGASRAQNRTSTPVHRNTSQGASTTPVVTSSAQNSNMHAINNKIRLQMRQIHKDLKAGKVTAEQAKAQMEKLKGLRKQELEFFHQNSQKEITADQKSQLEKMLN